MAKALTVCAISIWLSTAVLDVANAVGTFRLTGPWPSSSAQRNLNQNIHGCSSHRQAHRTLHKHGSSLHERSSAADVATGTNSTACDEYFPTDAQFVSLV
jgi:hypothetical protein